MGEMSGVQVRINGEIKEFEALHYPTLRTVIEVENILRGAHRPIKRVEIRRKLKKVMPQTINVIIKYFCDRGMVIDTKKGVLWTHVDKAVIPKKYKKGIKL